MSGSHNALRLAALMASHSSVGRRRICLLATVMLCTVSRTNEVSAEL